MKKYILLLFVYSFLSGCLNRVDEISPYPDFFLATVEPTENSIVLKWAYDFRISSNFNIGTPLPIIKPEKFIVLMGEDPTSLNVIKEMAPTDSILTFENLKTGSPYFFQVKLFFENNNFENRKYEMATQIVVATPNRFATPMRMKTPNSFIVKNIKGQIFHLSFSPDTTQLIASVRDQGSFVYSYKADTIVKISDYSGLPVWSPTGNKLLISSNYFEAKSTPVDIRVFNTSHDLGFPKIEKLINIPHNTVLGYTWNRNEKSILFSVPPKTIKQIDLDNIEITPFIETDRAYGTSYIWLDDNNLLIGDFGSLNGGYDPSNSTSSNGSIDSPLVYNISSKTSHRLWNTVNIGNSIFYTLIQKNTKLAYISTQAGYPAIWIYDLKGNTVRQLTRRLSSKGIIIYNLQWHETFGFLSFSLSEIDSTEIKSFKVKVS